MSTTIDSVEELMALVGYLLQFEEVAAE